MKHLLLLLVLISQAMFAQTNSASVVYKISLNEESFKKVSSGLVSQMVAKSDSVYATLQFNTIASHYTLNPEYTKKIGLPNLIQAFGGSNGLYYYNQNTKEFVHESLVTGEPLVIIKKPVEWTIVDDETKLINGYVCKKAIRERGDINSEGLAKKPELIAWFCPEIPFSFGPERFNGLPGLVLECNSNIVKFEFENIIWHKKELNIDKPSTGEIIDEEELKKRFGRF